MKTNVLSELINELSVDFPAETLLAFMEDRFSLRDLIVSYEGQSRRGWSKDIYRASAEVVPSGREVLHLRLNRDGVYDGMPETVFHDLTGNDCATGGEMARESMRLKTQEKESRLFFQPLENEIFIKGLQLAKQENILFHRIIAQNIMGLLPDFWEIGRDLPPTFVHRMIRLLPVVHIIAGNDALIEQSLAFILGEGVCMKVLIPGNHFAGMPNEMDVAELGRSSLGVDFIAGVGVSGVMKRFGVKIGPIDNPVTLKMIRNGSLDRFLACFYSYFLPAEVEAETSFTFTDELGAFYLDPVDEEKAACLAYNTTIS